MGNLSPTEDQINDLVNSDYEGPVVMLNLLRFKREDGNCNKAKESYQKYRIEVSPLLEKVNGRTLYVGKAHHLIVGDVSFRWDLCLIVEYPSKKNFLDMVTDPQYQRILHYRNEALEDSVLLATKPT